MEANTILPVLFKKRRNNDISVSLRHKWGEFTYTYHDKRLSLAVSFIVLL